MNVLTRLDKLYFRLQAQHECLAWAFGAIDGKPGLVLELGLGHGRTYDHMRRHLPGREIFVFDREVDCIADCRPPPERLIVGEIGKTLAAQADRLARRIILAHADLGTYDRKRDDETASMLATRLPPLLVPGAIVISDLPLDFDDAEPLPLPDGAQEGRYFLYRRRECT
ncbi:class I SAM-dependent methyltransferase [Mesorhizobium sp. LHD-90]|uniref:class I SAM-dependent methyltransferase n=1 Tax=Mesorhizobium sp. LHD-90 TaxID=3071414 RepID=UPI0027E03D9A|nr:class I SAM-dependent methyltransferase [Mesorhizobium sp. LHD-90]MDQ6438227.1 class I SAM-dependent methyltransferase [Mesorhizobium sp. LHD-90]